MNKHQKLQCWNCPKTFYSPVEITDEQEIIVHCPYCRVEAVVNLKPYRKKGKVMSVLKGENPSGQGNEEFQLPEIIPTKKRN
jgi:DNA-directed RNA polymerase subunit RPC12/RpoP